MTIHNPIKLDPTIVLKCALIGGELLGIMSALKPFESLTKVKFDEKSPSEFFCNFHKSRENFATNKTNFQILKLLVKKELVFGLSVIKELPEEEEIAEREFEVYKENISQLKMAIFDLDSEKISKILENFPDDESIIIDGIDVVDYFNDYLLEMEDTDPNYEVASVIWEMLLKKTDFEGWVEYLAEENICVTQPTQDDPIKDFKYVDQIKYPDYSTGNCILDLLLGSDVESWV